MTLQYIPVESHKALPPVRSSQEQQLYDFLKNLRVPAQPTYDAEIAALTAAVDALSAAVDALSDTVAAIVSYPPGGAVGDVQTNSGSGFNGITGITVSPPIALLGFDGTTLFELGFTGGVLTSFVEVP